MHTRVEINDIEMKKIRQRINEMNFLRENFEYDQHQCQGQICQENNSDLFSVSSFLP